MSLMNLVANNTLIFEWYTKNEIIYRGELHKKNKPQKRLEKLYAPKMKLYRWIGITNI